MLLKTGEIPRERLLENIRKAWKENGFDDPEWVKNQPGWYKHAPVEEWCQWASNMWNEVPGFLDETFSEWETVEAEEMLYESIENRDLNFKGYIDAIIKCKDSRGKEKYWILDWKTAGAWGWRRDKKQDILMTAQLILYKHYWSRKHGIPLTDIRCGFILLKRGGKLGKICELVPVSVGPKSLERANKIVGNMISAVRRGLFLKNRNSCKYCDFLDTPHCT